MSASFVRRRVASANWIDRPADAIAGAVSAVYRPLRPLQDLLNGTVLGHPLHPLVTDVVIGAWTVTLVLDLLGLAGVGGLAGGAAVALWLGVLAALGSLLTGLTDWKDTYGLERRVGFIHALLMTLATVLYIVSGLARLGGSGGGAAVVGILGYLAVIVGGYLGGEMAFGFGSMVDHNAFRDGIGKFTPACPLADLAQGMTALDVKGRPVLLVRDGDSVTAIGNVCSHAGGPLNKGTLENGVVTCPWHGSRFRVADGSVVRGPATFAQPAYEVRIAEDGTVEVRSSNA